MRFSFLQKLGASVLITAWVLYGSIMAGDLLIHADEPEALAALKIVTPTPAPSTPAAETGGNLGGETAAALLASANSGDGEKVFKKCKACHTAGKGGAHKVGPNLWDVVGRAKAGAEGYKFSGVLAGLGGAWSYEDLDAFLTKPKAFAPGTKMTFAGLKKAADRAAIIAYLRALSDSPKPLP